MSTTMAYIPGLDPSPQPRFKLTAAQVREIRSLKGQATRAALAVRFGISRSNISAIWQRKTWTHL